MGAVEPCEGDRDAEHGGGVEWVGHVGHLPACGEAEEKEARADYGGSQGGEMVKSISIKWIGNKNHLQLLKIFMDFIIMFLFSALFYLF